MVRHASEARPAAVVSAFRLGLGASRLRAARLLRFGRKAALDAAVLRPVSRVSSAEDLFTKEKKPLGFLRRVLARPLRSCIRRPVCRCPMTALLAQSLVTPSLGLIFWKTVAFLIFLYVLYRFGWGPITNSLQEREEEIEGSIQRAEEALAEAKKIQEENKKARRNAEQKAQRILREARESAEELREEEETKTRRKIQQMKEQAQAEIEREKQAALQELRDEVADLAIQAARKIVEDDLDRDRHRELVRDAIEDFPAN